MSLKKNSLAFTVSSVLVLAASGAHAQTSTISFNFSGNTDSFFNLTTFQTAGFVPASHWNNADSNTGTVGIIRYSDGTTASTGGTNTSLTFNSSQALDNQIDGSDPNFGSDPNSVLMNGFIQSGTQGGLPQNATVTVSNIPFSSYSVYAYFYNGDEQASTSGTFNVTTTANPTGTPTTVETLDTFDPANPLVKATSTSQGDYVVFTGISGSSFTLSALPANGNFANTNIPLTGFQIVGTPAAAPEPAGFVPVFLGALLLGGLVTARRRTMKALS